MNNFVISSSSRRWQSIGLIAGALAGLLLSFFLQRSALVGCGMLVGVLAGRAIDVRRSVLKSAFYFALTTLVIVAAAYIVLRRE